MSAGEHLRPSFFIIGERKCGTSSLYRYLVAHPHVLPGRLKEPNFFGQHAPSYIAAHIDEYFAQFPRRNTDEDSTLHWPELDESGLLYEEPVHFERVPGRHYVTGEASANTFQEVPPTLLRQHIPDLKLILLVRNPVERAHSHHRMYARFQAEGRPLGFRVGEFESDMRAEITAIRAGKETPCLSPGIYVERLKRWVEVWGWSRLRVYRTEDLDLPERCREIVDDVQRYLGLPHHDYGAYLERRFNRAPPAEIPTSIRDTLTEFYDPYNRALEAYLGRSLDWR